MKTNSLKHTIHTFDKEGNTVEIVIRLSDECNNGHQDFAITGTIWKKGKSKTDRNMITGGAIGDKIAKLRPDLAIFNKLHLCDYKGIPMHPVSNGFYHMKIELGRKKAEFCAYYRITPAQFDELAKAQNKVQYYQALVRLNVFEQWEKQANEAINLLEKLTGKEFLIDSKRTQLDAPKPEEIQEEECRQKEGYYTPEATAKREAEYSQGLIYKLAMERNKAQAKAQLEYDAKLAVLKAGGKEALDNMIFYSHTNKVKFNWASYNQLSEARIAQIKSATVLPEGVTFEN